MDIAGGYAAEKKIQEEKAKILKTASADEKKAENGSAKVIVIKKAGHHGTYTSESSSFVGTRIGAPRHVGIVDIRFPNFTPTLFRLVFLTQFRAFESRR